MNAWSNTSGGMNLNPLAPAQSKHTFPFSEKARHSSENASIPAPFFCPFLHLYRAFSRQVTKGTQGPDPEPEKDTKMAPNGVQMEPRGHKVKPQGSRKCKKISNMQSKGLEMEPPVQHWSSRSPQMQNTHNKLTQIAKKTHQKVPQGTKQRRNTM